MEHYSHKLKGNFVVIDKGKIRFRKV